MCDKLASRVNFVCEEKNMKVKMTVLLCVMFLSACSSNYVEFTGIKVIDDKFDISLETNNKEQVEALEALFNDRMIDNHLAPEFKYLIEIATAEGSTRWKYSIDGFMQLHAQGEQPIYALINRNEFNQMVNID